MENCRSGQRSLPSLLPVASARRSTPPKPCEELGDYGLSQILATRFAFLTQKSPIGFPRRACCASCGCSKDIRIAVVATTSPTAAAAFCAISRTTWDMTTRTPHFRIDAAGALCFCHGPLAPPGRASAMSARGPRRTALAPPRAGFPKKRPPAPLVGGPNRRPWRADASCR